MTLFKKIFDNHAQAIERKGVDHARQEEEDAGLRDVFVLPPEMRGLLQEDEPAAPEPEDMGWRETLEDGEEAWQAGAEGTGDAGFADLPGGAFDSPEDMAPESVPQAEFGAAASLADRAAEAQRQMMETRARMDFQAPPPMPRDAAAQARPDEPDPARAEGPLPRATEGRAGRRAGRVKTRLLGFNASEDFDVADPLQTAKPAPQAQAAPFPVGWFVVVRGPGRGHAFALHSGVTLIGRGEDQGIRLDFGDTSISRQNHAAIAYDDEQNGFYLGHGGKSNIIRLNDRPVLSTEEVRTGDLVRIGETTLRLVALCGADFNWAGGGCDDA